ncbi:MAG: hypothetical protein A2Y82_03575 [Candidatus Buchananbacteria bacterium RBG_13_36_9]|uniref:aspartate kinase n=1 Tax=Candidatus Buchananbacteria bacterium RBG_13_36_9 TaxID=1797530 RepID=A0A1G1XLM9_9BACT|nr:MAG: hypothetical protein A2Y82_03575 [Candidatus Buchananbacteria bacterium RBG_13_36_9]
MSAKKRLVMKFGGKCLANENLIIKIANYLKQCLTKQPGLELVVVVSAMGDFTDKTLEQIQKLAPRLYHTDEKSLINREIDYATQSGEGISAAFLAIALNGIGVKARSLNAFQLRIQTTGDYQSAQIKDIDLNRLEKEFACYQVLVVTGFQGIHKADDAFVTLGRGGSDTTAVALAARLKCKCEFYKASAGITAFEPKYSDSAKVLSFITYADAKDLSQYGYEFLQPRCLDIAQRFSVPLEFKASPGLGNDPWAPGTVIGESLEQIEDTSYNFSALASKEDLALITLTQVKNLPGWSEKIFEVFKIVNLLDFQQIMTGPTAIINLIMTDKAYHKIHSNENDLITQIKDLDHAIEICERKGLICLTFIDSRMADDPGIGYLIAQALCLVGTNIEGQYSSGNKIHTFIAGAAGKAILSLANMFNLIQLP